MNGSSFSAKFIPLLLLLMPLSAAGQAPADSSRMDIVDSSSIDTVLYKPNIDRSGARAVDNAVDLEEHLTQKPTVALFKSMFVPGWGQIGNRKYVKAGIIMGVQAWLISSAIKHGNDASDLKEQWQAETDVAQKLALYNAYDDKRGQRNKFYWFIGITTFVSMFDAYVDAHLSGSPTDERNDKFTLDVVPDIDGGARLQATLSF